MTISEIAAQYSTGLSRHNIEQALAAAGLDSDHLQRTDLGLLEDFHTMGPIATSQLTELAEITSDDRVLDAGSGIGGTARFLADQYKCRVTAIDLTEEYCEIARWLNRLTGLDDRISVWHGSVTDLPFADASFDVAISQHVQMNVADKTRLYAEARRVLGGGGRLAIWDIVAGDSPEKLDFPMPWADRPELSHLVSAGQLRALIEEPGFVVEQWNDLTDDAAALMKAIFALPPSPLGLQAFVHNFTDKAGNLTEGLASGRLRVIQGIARAVEREAPRRKAFVARDTSAG
jgi:sarcosine/dimethylglycine N-methyltransferase